MVGGEAMGWELGRILEIGEDQWSGGGIFEERGGGSILGIEGKTMVGDWKFIRRMRNQSMPPD